jgi:hypothetical protein
MRPLIRQLWNDAPYPADPVYLLGMLHDKEKGRIPLDPEPAMGGRRMKRYESGEKTLPDTVSSLKAQQRSGSVTEPLGFASNNDTRRVEESWVPEPFPQSDRTKQQ